MASSGAIAAVSGGASSIAIAAAIANAVKASGAIVKVESADFETIVNKMKDPLVVLARGGLFSKSFQYLTSYKGLFFYCKASNPIQLPPGVEVVSSKNIWIPG